MGNKQCCCADDVGKNQKDILDAPKQIPATSTREENVPTRAPPPPVAAAPAPVTEPEPEETKPPPRKVEETAATTEVAVGGLFTVVLVKEDAGARLGMAVDIADTSRMIVDKVSGGLVQQWNDNNKDKVIKEGDEVMSINGVAGDAMQMSEVVQKEVVLELVVKRMS